MSDRPSGDHLDQQLRAVMAEIASAVQPAPTLDELRTPHPTSQEASPVHPTRSTLILAAVVVAIAAVVGIFLTIGGDEQGLDTVDDPVTTTTTESAADDEPPSTTTSPDADPDDSADEPEDPPPVDQRAIANSRTWEELTPQISVDRALVCALSPVRLDFVTVLLDRDGEEYFVAAFAEGPLILELPEAEARLLLSALGPLSRIDVTALERASQSDDVGVVTPAGAAWVEGIRAAVVDVEDAIGAGGPVDVGPIFDAFVESIPATGDLTCPFGAGRLIASDFSSFSSTATNFGGRGKPAALRCASMAALRLALDQVIEGDRSGSAVSLMADSFELSAAFWTERDPDPEFQTLIDRWNGLALGGGDLTDEDIDELAMIRDGLLEYRASAPEDGQLCPLDDGYTPG